MSSLLTALSDLLIQLILVGCAISILAFALFGAYTLFSTYHAKLLELERSKCQSLFAKLLGEEGARTAALTAEVEGLRRRVLETTKQKEEVEARILKREVGFLEMEAKWGRERDELERTLNELAISSRHAADIIELKASIQGMDALCASKDVQIQALTQAMEGVEATSERYTDKITELTDKLSEYHRRLVAVGDMNATFNSSAAKAMQRPRTRSSHRKRFRRPAASASGALDRSSGPL